jgi:hypothetical protein
MCFRARVDALNSSVVPSLLGLGLDSPVWNCTKLGAHSPLPLSRMSVLIVVDYKDTSVRWRQLRTSYEGDGER